MKCAKYPGVMAVGDAEGLTEPKCGAFGDQEAHIVAKNIAIAVGAAPATEAKTFVPMIVCFGDAGDGKGYGGGC